MSYCPVKRREYYLKQKEKDPLLETYRSMIQRCYNNNKDSYEYYGGRGIKVCERWLCKEKGYQNFKKDMGDRPKKHTLDRIDVNKDYEPLNCRWANGTTQAMNKNPYSATGYKYIYKKHRYGKDFYRIRIEHLNIDTTRRELQDAINLVQSLVK